MAAAWITSAILEWNAQELRRETGGSQGAPATPLTLKVKEPRAVPGQGDFFSFSCKPARIQAIAASPIHQFRGAHRTQGMFQRLRVDDTPDFP